MSRQVQANEQGQLQGAIASIRGITGVIGPFVMNGTFALTAGNGAFTEMPGMVYFLAAMLVAFTLLIAWQRTQVRPELATE
jgi:DHA1 family tetracycline resistance protein-like MFS transporter